MWCELFNGNAALGLKNESDKNSEIFYLNGLCSFLTGQNKKAAEYWSAAKAINSGISKFEYL